MNYNNINLLVGWLVGVDFSSLLLISLLSIVIKISEVDATTGKLIVASWAVGLIATKV
jgi:hypothetical protein